MQYGAVELAGRIGRWMEMKEGLVVVVVMAAAMGSDQPERLTVIDCD